MGRKALAGMDATVAVVVVTMNRCEVLRRTLEHLLALTDAPLVVVVDNGSSDGTFRMLLDDFPAVLPIRLNRNIGAAARTVGVRHACTKYIAFCDDDCWWAAGAITRGLALLETHAGIALLNARVMIGGTRVDASCLRMAAARRDDALPGIPIQMYMAGACIVRSVAFLACGGYDRRFHIGAEETLLAHDLLAAGWQLRYVDDLVLHHEPCAQSRDQGERRYYVLRNRAWTAWMRQRMPRPLTSTWSLLRAARRDEAARAALRDVFTAMPWILRERHVVSPEVQSRIDPVWRIDE
jgi:GT2 family glycosyltransferase